jgi:hypothetical protein
MTKHERALREILKLAPYDVQWHHIYAIAVEALGKCERCGSIEVREVIAIAEPNLPWHDGRSPRQICAVCPAEVQLPWAQEFEDA